MSSKIIQYDFPVVQQDPLTVEIDGVAHSALCQRARAFIKYPRSSLRENCDCGAVDDRLAEMTKRFEDLSAKAMRLEIMAASKRQPERYDYDVTSIETPRFVHSTIEYGDPVSPGREETNAPCDAEDGRCHVYSAEIPAVAKGVVWHNASKKTLLGVPSGKKAVYSGKYGEWDLIVEPRLRISQYIHHVYGAGMVAEFTPPPVDGDTWTNETSLTVSGVSPGCSAVFNTILDRWVEKADTTPRQSKFLAALLNDGSHVSVDEPKGVDQQITITSRPTGKVPSIRTEVIARTVTILNRLFQEPSSQVDVAKEMLYCRDRLSEYIKKRSDYEKGMEAARKRGRETA